MPNFGDPSTFFRLVISALSAISVILLVAGTALDEYVEWQVVGVRNSLGCQKLADLHSGFEFRAPFKLMSMLSFVIILATSVLCLLQAIATVLNALVLLKVMNPKSALIVTSALTVLLLAAFIAVNVGFTTERRNSQFNVIALSSEFRQAYKDFTLSGKADSGIPQSFNTFPLYWSHSFSLLSAAFSFAIINQILLIAIHQMSKSGVSTFGVLMDKIVSRVTDRTWVTRFCITLLNGLLLILMVTGTAIDRYCGVETGCTEGTRLSECHYWEARTFQQMPTLAFVLLIVTCVVCALQAVAFILCVVLMKKDTALSIPLLVLSVLSTVLLLASVVLASVNFTAENYDIWTNKMVYKHSFISLCVSFAFSIVNTALNILNIVFSKRGGSGSGYSPLDTASTQSTGGIVSQPSQPSSSYADPQLSSK